MCIRDSPHAELLSRSSVDRTGRPEPALPVDPRGERGADARLLRPLPGGGGAGRALAGRCLLYTSDAADERSSVDLGGRRII